MWGRYAAFVVLAILVVVPEKGAPSPCVVNGPVKAPANNGCSGIEAIVKVVVTGVRGLGQETDDEKQCNEQGPHEI